MQPLPVILFPRTDDEYLNRGNIVIHLWRLISSRMLMFAPHEIAFGPLTSLDKIPKAL